MKLGCYPKKALVHRVSFLWQHYLELSVPAPLNHWLDIKLMLLLVYKNQPFQQSGATLKTLKPILLPQDQTHAIIKKKEVSKENVCPRHPSLFSCMWHFSALWAVKIRCSPLGSWGAKSFSHKTLQKAWKGWETNPCVLYQDHKLKVSSHVLQSFTSAFWHSNIWNF